MTQEEFVRFSTITRAVALALLTLVAGGPALAAAQAVKVGAVVPLTGRYGAGGAQVRAGTRSRSSRSTRRAA